MSSPAPRLWFVLAKEAPVGAILLRDPSKRVQLIRWNLEDDMFEAGQWLDAKVFEPACDISPDGLLFSCTAAGSSGGRFAVSRLPYFAPLALWPVSASAAPVGVFVNKHVLRADLPSRHPKEGRVPGWFDIDRGPVGANLLQTWHGWTPVFKGFFDEVMGLPCKVFAKPFGEGRVLRDFSGHEPAHRFESLPLEAADCADIDGKGRILLSRGAKLFAYDAEAKQEIELADFGNTTFGEVTLPEWANSWLEPVI